MKKDNLDAPFNIIEIHFMSKLHQGVNGSQFDRFSILLKNKGREAWCHSCPLNRTSIEGLLWDAKLSSDCSINWATQPPQELGVNLLLINTGKGSQAEPANKNLDLKVDWRMNHMQWAPIC